MFILFPPTLFSIPQPKTKKYIKTNPILGSNDQRRFWHRLNGDTQQTIKNELLIGVEQEQQPSVRKKLADAVSELALFLSTHCPAEEALIERQWPQLLPFLFRLSKSENEEQRRSALEMFSKLCLYLGDSLKAHINILKDVLTSGLTDQKSLKVRTSLLIHFEIDHAGYS